MKTALVAIALGLVGLAASITPGEAQTRLGLVGASWEVGNAASASTVERRRSTCWRTNRATGQKFRIC